MIKTRTYYVIKTLIFFAFSNRSILSIRELSERLSISVKVMEQILLRMKRANLVMSMRGPHGGYSLVGDPSVLSLQDVLDKVNNEIKIIPGDIHTMFDEMDDVLSGVTGEIEVEVKKVLSGIKIGDLVKRMQDKVAETRLDYTI